MSFQTKYAYVGFFRKIKGKVNYKGNFVPFKRKEKKTDVNSNKST